MIARGERGARQRPPEAGVAGPQLGVAAELLARERDARLDARGRLSRLRECDPDAVPSDGGEDSEGQQSKAVTADRIEPPDGTAEIVASGSILVRFETSEFQFLGSAELAVGR